MTKWRDFRYFTIPPLSYGYLVVLQWNGDDARKKKGNSSRCTIVGFAETRSIQPPSVWNVESLGFRCPTLDHAEKMTRIESSTTTQRASHDLKPAKRGRIVEQYLRMRDGLSQADVRVSGVMNVDWDWLGKGLAVWRAVERTTDSVLLELALNHSSQIYC